MKTRIVWLVAFCILLGSAVAQAAVMTWTVGGVERKALVFAPPGHGGGKVPLVFAFHGHGGNMRGAARGMAFQKAWPGAIVVYMQGLPTPSKIDPQGRRPGWQHELGENGDRDLKFFDAVLATLRQKYPVDDRRIYATGFSNGAFFTYFLWAERGKTFAAFGPCAGLIWPTLQLTEPKPALHVGGQADPLVKFADQEKTIETVRQLDGATAAGTSCGTGCTLYPSPKDTPVETFIHPGGHVFPPAATDLIVKFFKEHSLAP
ncbi:MAG TPA: esterase [Thermoanaerobaculia bacterium]|nr:esterase [Thermoanaerobaculia bacterium]